MWQGPAIFQLVNNSPFKRVLLENRELFIILGRSLGERNGNPLQYSCLENPMDRGARWATVHGVTKRWAWLSDWARSRRADIISLFSQVRYYYPYFSLFSKYLKTIVPPRVDVRLEHKTVPSGSCAMYPVALWVNWPRHWTVEMCGFKGKLMP